MLPQILRENFRDVMNGSYGFVISPEYLEQSNISPSYHKGLLNNADEAQVLGLLYVEMEDGRFRYISPDMLIC